VQGLAYVLRSRRDKHSSTLLRGVCHECIDLDKKEVASIEENGRWSRMISMLTQLEVIQWL